MVSVAAMALSGILLLPSVGGVTVNPYARVSLAGVSDTNRLEHWADLVAFLNDNSHKKLDVNRQLLTDPVTGYLVDSMTQYRGYSWKFLPSPAYYRNPFAFDSYEDFPLSRYSGQLIVINMRNGGPSENGHRSGHWHRDVLRLTDYYPDGLLPHLRDHPERFEKLWENDRTYVFRIR